MTRIQQSVQSGFSKITDALGDPAREAIVSALSDGKAMPAGELAIAAGVSPQSASAHLQKLVDARVLSVWSQGRFRYYRIADDDVASLIESLVDLAAKAEQVDRKLARLPQPLRFVPQRADPVLAQRLRSAVQGEVLLDRASRGRYATDASIYQVDPVGVLVPRSDDDVAAALAVCRDLRVPMLPRGAGSSHFWKNTSIHGTE